MSAKPSKRRIQCWYCAVEMMRSSLPLHTAEEHPGQHVREKGVVSVTVPQKKAKRNRYIIINNQKEQIEICG